MGGLTSMMFREDFFYKDSVEMVEKEAYWLMRHV